MLNIYNSIAPQIGPHRGGIYKIQIAPREWLLKPLLTDFATNSILTTIELRSGRNFLEISFLPDSYEYEEKPKTNKAGQFFEIELSGTTNNINAYTQQIFHTFRYHEFVAIVYDKQRRKRVVGNIYEGLIFSYRNKETGSNGGLQNVAIAFNMDLENPAPFYGLDPVILPQLPIPLLIAESLEPTVVFVSWQPYPIGTTYLLERSDDPNFGNNLVQLNVTFPNTYYDTDLNPGTYYYYRIVAYLPGYYDSLGASAAVETLPQPSAIPFPDTNLYSWFDAANGIANPDSIDEWLDSSDNQNNLYNQYILFQPRLEASALNALPGVRMKQEANPQANLRTSGNFPSTNGFTIIFVATQISNSFASDNNGTFLQMSGGTIFSRHGINWGVKLKLNDTDVIYAMANDATYYTWTIVFTSQQITLFCNGVVAGSAPRTVAIIETPLHLFSDEYTSARGNKILMEMIAFNQTITSVQQEATEAYLKNKYMHY